MLSLLLLSRILQKLHQILTSHLHNITQLLILNLILHNLNLRKHSRRQIQIRIHKMISFNITTFVTVTEKMIRFYCDTRFKAIEEEIEGGFQFLVIGVLAFVTDCLQDVEDVGQVFFVFALLDLLGYHGFFADYCRAHIVEKYC